MPSIPAQARATGNLLPRWLLLVFCTATLAHGAPPSAAEYPSIQEAIDANPGAPIYIPAGDHEISAKLRLTKDRIGLYGPGRIVQKNPEQPILQIEKGEGIEVRGVTLTRAEGQMDASKEGLFLLDCREPIIENVRVLENRSPAAAISLRNCTGARVRDCLVQNYMGISIDDRTRTPEYGYAFRCIDGSGIVTDNCLDTLLEGNRVIERHLLPTPEIKAQYGLGKFTKKNAIKGSLMSQAVWDAEYVNNWHQGSGIVINGPRISDRTLLLGNQIENAAQGLDIHADRVTVSNNIINNAFIGMKAMHGSRHVIITGNQFIKNDLWSIGLMPGAASDAAHEARDGRPAQEPNTDGASIVANNVISQFGYGHAAWIWSPESAAPIRFDHGQNPDDPPLTDVLIQGNIIFDSGTDLPLVDGKPTRIPPRYGYAVRIEGGPTAPQGLHFSGNLLHPGVRGVSNVELPP